MKVLITQELTGAWEEWIAEVPDDSTNEQIKSGNVEIEYLGIADSGFTSATMVEVEEID